MPTFKLKYLIYFLREDVKMACALLRDFLYTGTIGTSGLIKTYQKFFILKILINILRSKKAMK